MSMNNTRFSKLQKLFAPVDMTAGNPGKQIVAFAIPMLIGNNESKERQFVTPFG